jgi:hypothetical protein
MRRLSGATSHTKWAVTLCLLAAGAQLAAQNSNSQPKKVHGFSATKKAPDFENDQVIVNPPQTPPWPGAGDPGTDIPKTITARFGVRDWHNHKLNRVVIRFQPAGERLNYLDGSSEVLKWQAGAVEWSPAAGFHYSDNHWTTGPGATSDYIAIKKPGYPSKVGGAALDPLRVDPKDFKLEFENSQVRVLRLKIGPRQSVPMHEHVLGHVVVYLTDQNVRETSPEGKAEVRQHEMFDFSWNDPAKHKIDNLSDRPFEAVVVELKTIY